MKRFLVVGVTLLFVLALMVAMADLSPAKVDLRPAVAANLAASGVDHPVTAVLLNFRGYDTLLEIAVLLLALLGLLSVVKPCGHPVSAEAGGRADPLLQMLARTAAPLMVVVAIYLLWAGAFRPGGAFQAGAVLAAAAVLLHLAGLLPGWRQPGRLLRGSLMAGLLVFLLVAAALLQAGGLLRYPPSQAGLLIVLIESGLTFSLGFMLAGLFLFLSHDKGGQP